MLISIPMLPPFLENSTKEISEFLLGNGGVLRFFCRIFIYEHWMDIKASFQLEICKMMEYFQWFIQHGPCNYIYESPGHAIALKEVDAIKEFLVI